MSRLTSRRNHYSIFDEVERELAQDRHRRRANFAFWLILVMALTLCFFAIIGGGAYFMNWASNYGPTGEIVGGIQNPMDNVEWWQSEPRSSDRVWN